MPELPDLLHQVPILRRELAGRRITEAHVGLPVVMRQVIPGDPSANLVGARFTEVVRRGAFVRFLLEDGPIPAEIAIHPMLAGRFSFVPAAQKIPVDTGFSMVLDDGRRLRFRDDRQMGKVYIIPPGEFSSVPGLDRIGIDILDDAVFTWEAFSAIAKKRRDQAKSFLLDHAAIDTLGNAYSDEVLHEAHLHPKARMNELTDAQRRALYDALVAVPRHAAAEIQTRNPPLDEKLRDFLKVRNRKGPCPDCGTEVRTCGIHGHDAYFCPTCQPDGKGRGFVDWSRLKR